MENVLSKLALARQAIKATKIKKDAKNDFSKYDYFSPELIGKLVSDACIETDSICLFNLKKDELGYFGELIFTDLESKESITTIMRTERPQITATNETQQMGGMQTYTKRYCMMNLFDIEDNTIDFDSQDNTKPAKTYTATDKQVKDEKPWLNKTDPQYKSVIKRLQDRTATIPIIEKHFKLSKEMRAALEAVTHKKKLNEFDLNGDMVQEFNDTYDHHSDYDAGDLPY